MPFVCGLKAYKFLVENSHSKNLPKNTVEKQVVKA